VRTAGAPRRYAAAVRRRVQAVDRDRPVTKVESMEEVLEAGASQTWLTMSLVGGFSLCAMLLGAVGIYGTVAYSVSERTQELGIRMALGAGRRDILRMVLGHGLKLAAAGVATGVAISLAATRLLGSLLYHVRARDPVTLAVSGLIFTVAAFLASYRPARRAMDLDPSATLRQ